MKEFGLKYQASLEDPIEMLTMETQEPESTLHKSGSPASKKWKIPDLKH